jgi:hypothetical protein
MSSSNAAAKKRRAPASIEPPAPPPQNRMAQSPGPSMNSPGLTLPQVIALIDKRLVHLETFVVDSKKNGLVQQVSAQQVSAQTSSVQQQGSTQPASMQLSQMDDFNTRFDALADEIANMKNIVLSLQSYTMDVNKVLMEERVRILSEVSNDSTSYHFTNDLEESNNSEALEKIKSMISDDST